jgi:hypothetical protein
MLALSLTLSGIILAIQFPILMYSPDGSYQAAKILRASQGDFFTDAITGISSIYPSLFHFVFGIVNRALGLNPIQLIQLIVLSDFLALFLAFYYFVTAFLKNAEEASLCVLSLSLVIYAPTSHYILLPQPSNFSFVFTLLSMGALYRYVMSQSVSSLIFGGLLGSLAINIWFPNVFFIFPIMLVVIYYLVRNGKGPSFSHAAIFSLAFLIPCLWTAWHLYCIREILPYYLPGKSMHHQVPVSERLTAWASTFLTKGNLPFMRHMNFWDSSGSPTITENLLSDATKRLHTLVSVVHYFVVVMPFNILLLTYSAVFMFRAEERILRDFSLLRTLAIGGCAVLLCTSVMPLIWDLSKLRRVHFLMSIMFLVFAFTTAPVLVRSISLRKLSSYVGLASMFALVYTVVYSPRLFTSTLSESDHEIIQFVSSIPDRDHQRIFMLGEGLRRVVPFVTLNSFLEASEGRYFHQDPLTASKLYGDHLAMMEKAEGWQIVAREGNIKWVIMRVSDPTELNVFNTYVNHGVVRLRNHDWAVLELSV